jgi:hypothetical protein
VTEELPSRQVGLLDLAVSILGRFRLPRIVPSTEIAARGSAKLRRSEHLGIYFVGMEKRLVAPHLDISLELLTKGHEPVALVDLAGAKAADQELRQGSEVGGRDFTPLSLEPGKPWVDSWFQLQAPEGEELRAGPGDDVAIRFQLGRNSRPLPVRLRVAPVGNPSR